MVKRILVVDDEPDMVVIMKLTLETNGFEVITAYDGQEGMEKAQQEKPDLIILDVLMPKVFGNEIVTLWEKDPELSGIPIIMLTNVPLAFLSGERKRENEFEKDSKGNILLTKSCSEEELLAAIEQASQKL